MTVRSIQQTKTTSTWSPLQVLPGTMAREDFLGLVQAILAVQAILVIVAVAIDLSQFGDQVIGQSPDGLVGSAHFLAFYLSLRIVDMVTRMLPIAVFVGVLGFELWSVVTWRRAIHWASGRHPLHLLGPLVAIGALFGALQYGLEVRWRAEAVMTQASLHLGAYGQRFGRGSTTDPTWFVAGDALIHAGFKSRPNVALTGVDIYRLDSDGRVGEVVRAPSAEPVGRDGMWRLIQPTRWVRSSANSSSFSRVEDRRDDLIPIPVHPLAVEYMNIPAKYIPNEDLAAIARAGLTSLVAPDQAVWLAARRANAFLPLAMALLAAGMSLFSGASRPTVATILLCGLSGYTAYVLMRVSVSLGELDSLPAEPAAWAPVVIILAAAIAATAIALRRG